MARTGLAAERVVRAGADLADEIGFEHVTPSELARKLGIRTASLYSHVKNAHDLKTKIALLALEELADRASAALAGRAGRDALGAFANAYRDYALQHPGRFAAAGFRLDADAAAASAACPALPDDAGDPARLRPDRAPADARGAAPGQRLQRLRGAGGGRMVSATAPPIPRRAGRRSSMRSTPCCAAGPPLPDPAPAPRRTKRART